MKLIDDWNGADMNAPVLQPEMVIQDLLPPTMSKQELIALCGGDRLAARKLFEQCEWESPEAKLAELGGIEGLVYEQADIDSIRTEYRLTDSVYNRAKISGSATSVEIMFPDGADALLFGHRMDEVRRQFGQAFEEMLGPEPKVEFSPLPTPSTVYPVILVIHGNSLDKKSPATCAFVSCTRTPDAFAIRAMHEMFAALYKGRHETISIWDTAIAPSEHVEALHRQLFSIERRYEPGDARLILERAEYFRRHYRVDKSVLATNRGYAYIGPIIHRTESHYFQLDKVDNEVVMHPCHLVNSPMAMGENYCVIQGAGKGEVSALPVVVADALARDIRHTRQALNKRGEAAFEGTGRVTLLKISASHIEVCSGDDGLHQFKVGDIEVAAGGEDRDLHGFRLSYLDEAQARELRDQGFGVHYAGRDRFVVDIDEIYLAAYEKLADYQPKDTVASNAIGAWAQAFKARERSQAAMPH